MTSATVLLVEDEPNLAELIKDVLRGYRVEWAPSIARAEALLERWSPDVLLLDVKLPDGDGIELLGRVRSRGHLGPAVVMTAFGTIDRAVSALRAGAHDFLVKPFDNARLLSAIEAALAAGARLEEVALTAPGRLKPGAPGAASLIGQDRGLKDVVAIIGKVAQSEATVLIRGESGTGKELVARAIHSGSARRDGPFVSLNCAALPPSLLESELFGFERGAFTGAHDKKKGHVEAADGGTLFLDEMGDMSLDAQVRLLRVLQEREIVRVGGRAPIKVDVRVIAATHRDLAARVEEGLFRADLLFRLDVVPIDLPPLRDRPEDIPALMEHFLEKHARRHRSPAPRPSPAVLTWASRAPWPGNVRELENFVERAVVLGEFVIETRSGSAPSAASAPPPGPPAPPAPAGEVKTLKQAVAEAERAAVVAALRSAAGNKAQAARLLGVSYKTLFNKIHEHDIREALQIE